MVVLMKLLWKYNDITFFNNEIQMKANNIFVPLSMNKNANVEFIRNS